MGTDQVLFHRQLSRRDPLQHHITVLWQFIWYWAKICKAHHWSSSFFYIEKFIWTSTVLYSAKNMHCTVHRVFDWWRIYMIIEYWKYGFWRKKTVQEKYILSCRKKWLSLSKSMMLWRWEVYTMCHTMGKPITHSTDNKTFLAKFWQYQGKGSIYHPHRPI